MAQKATPLVIGIAGGTGSGKTTLANLILERVGPEHAIYIPHDAYYKSLNHLPKAQRAEVNFDHPDSLETELLIEHLRKLTAWQAIELPIYDFTTHTRTKESVHIEPKTVIMVEGILVFAETDLRDLFDIKLFVDTDSDIRFIRRLQRDITERGRTLESVIHQYETTVRPMHLEFVEPSKRYADLIIPEGGFNEVALEMVIARIEAMARQIAEENNA